MVRSAEKGADTAAAASGTQSPGHDTIMIARNKHWRYIAAYHGPWLQFPVEMLDHLCQLNATGLPHSADADPDAAGEDVGSARPPLPTAPVGIVRPAIDPIVMADIIAARHLVDDATALVVRVAQMAAQPGAGALNMHTRRRLLHMAIGKLAEAYRLDEVAASVSAMQNAASFDDLFDRLSTTLPNELESSDAIYAHFFHERIPSRQLATYTSVEPLNRLVQLEPNVAEYYRTRGVVLCMKGRHSAAIRDFATAIQLARRDTYRQRCRQVGQTRDSRTKSSTDHRPATADVEPAESAEPADEANGTLDGGLPLFALAEDIRREPTRTGRGTERQVLFLRACCYLQWALHLICQVVQDAERACDMDVRINETTNKSAANRANQQRRQRRKRAAQHSKSTASGAAESSTDTSRSAQPPPPMRPASPCAAIGSAGGDRDILGDMAWDVNMRKYLENPMVPKLLDACRDPMNEIATKVTQLVRRAIRDYLRFLQWFPMSMISVTEVEACIAGERARMEGRTVEQSAQSISGPCISSTTPAKHSTFAAALYRNCFRDEGAYSPMLPPPLLDGAESTMPPSRPRGLSFPGPTRSRELNDFNDLFPYRNGRIVEPPTAEDDAQGDPALLDTPLEDGFPYITYHPLLTETHYSLALAQLLLGDWTRAVAWHARAQLIQRASTGYPIFLPPRSVAQSDYNKASERAQALGEMPAPDGQMDSCRAWADTMRTATRWLQRRRIEEAVAQARQQEALQSANGVATGGRQVVPALPSPIPLPPPPLALPQI